MLWAHSQLPHEVDAVGLRKVATPPVEAEERAGERLGRGEAAVRAPRPALVRCTVRNLVALEGEGRGPRPARRASSGQGRGMRPGGGPDVAPPAAACGSRRPPPHAARARLTGLALDCGRDGRRRRLCVGERRTATSTSRGQPGSDLRGCAGRRRLEVAIARRGLVWARRAAATASRSEVVRSEERQ
jgi:hypothetical protein